MKRLPVYIAVLVVAVLTPMSVGAVPLPVYSVPCGTEARVGYLLYNPPGPAQTYTISFHAQGVGTVRLHETPVYHWTDTSVNSPGGPTAYSYQKTIDRYPGRPTELFLDGNAAPCAVYPGGLTVTNVSITPSLVRSKITH